MSRMDGARAKVQRAKEHLQDLVLKRSDFLDLNPYGIVIEHVYSTPLRLNSSSGESGNRLKTIVREVQ